MNKKIINYLQLLLTVILIVFIVAKAGDFLEHVDWQTIANNWPTIIIAGLIFMGGYVVLAWHWLAVCRIIDSKVNPKQWLAFFASQPYKYLPTSLFTFSSRANFAYKFGMSVKHSSEAQLIENLNLIGSGLAIGGILLLLNTQILLGIFTIIIIGLACALVWNQKSLKIPKTKFVLDLRKWLKSVAIVSLGWIIMGLGFFVMVIGLEGRVEPFLSIAASSLATGLGILAFFAPGGIGIRELVFHYLSFASGTILIWRLTTFTVDIAIGAWAGWAISRSQR
jgi:hypothetical protein